MKRFIYYSLFVVYCMFSACTDSYVKDIYDDNELTISRYLERNNDYSELLKALKRTQYFNVLSLQGEFTLFAPDNNAFELYYKEAGISGLDELPDDEVKRLVETHIIEQKILSENFNAGRMAYPLSGESLIMSFTEEGLRSAMINEIGIKEFDLIRTNGVIHTMEEVITPVDATLGNLIAEDENFSVFYEAMKATGVIDILNQKSENDKSMYTLIAESNDAYANEGINSFDDLKIKYSDSEDVTDELNGLNRFMRYHIVLKDLTILEFKDGLYNTELNYPVKIKVDNQFRINVITDGDGNEVSGDIDLEYINKVGWNGTFHGLKTLLPIIEIEPEPVIHLGTDICIDKQTIDPEKGIYYGDAQPPWISSDKEVLQYECKSIGNYVEFYSPYLFNVTYKVFYETSTWQPGRTILGLYINDKMVGEPFVNEYEKIDLGSGKKGYYVGKVTINNSGKQRVKVKVEGAYLYPEDNIIRLKKIYFEPDI